jgi:hypothetical protein
LIASASSMSDVHMRAKVRTSSASSRAARGTARWASGHAIAGRDSCPDAVATSADERRNRLREHLGVAVDVGVGRHRLISAMLWNGVMSTPRLSR